MSIFHRPLCALFGGHDFAVIRGLIVCQYCGYVAGKKPRRAAAEETK